MQPQNLLDIKKLEQTTVHLTANGMIWMDLHGKIKHANPGACEMLKYSHETLTSMKIFDICPNVKSEYFGEKYSKKFKEHPRHTFESVVINKKGEKIPVEVTVFHIKHEKMDFLYSLFIDISKRKKLMEKVTNSEERLRAIFNNHFQLTGFLDLDGRLLMINQVALDFIDTREDEVLGKYFWQAPWFRHSEKLQHDVKHYVEEAAKGNSIRAEWEIFGTTGKKYIFDNVFKPVKDANGVPQFIIPEARDITEIRNAEQELKQAYNELKKLKDQLQDENLYLKEELRVNRKHANLIGQSPAFKKVLHQIEQVAKTNVTALILGETGTGKELVAHTIHDLSSRREHSLIKLNCAAIPPSLIESELFGHEKGAFTGAHTLKIGRFELADKGTIFLDEIGELSIDLQAKLLRVLQENEFERIGGTKTLKVDIRIIAATNRDLKAMIETGRFREDLYYRLNVFPVNIPPLRERTDDIPLLSNFLIRQIAKRMGKNITHISKKDMKKLTAYHWPGNIRELTNVLERSAVMNQENILEIGDWFQTEKKEATDPIDSVTLDELQRCHIIRILKKTKGRIRGENCAAQILGIKPTTLESRMKKLNINKYEILDSL